MSRAPAYFQTRSLPKEIQSVATYTARLLFAIVILGLNAHIMQFQADNVLVYSITLAIFTILTCAYSIAQLYAFTTAQNDNVSLGIHVFMTAFWLVDTGIVLVLGSQSRQLNSKAHFPTFLARTTIGGLELLLWFMPIPDLIVAIVDKKEDMSADDQIPISRMQATTHRPTPTMPTRRVEPWDNVVSGPPDEFFSRYSLISEVNLR